MPLPSSNPCVSIVMPVYNADRFLVATLESVLAQTLEDFELIAVNDGSTDGSLKILEAFAARDSRIRLLSRPNTGIVGARNDGLALVRGEYVACMDADDLAHPERLARQLHFLRNHPEIVCVGCRCLIVDEEGDPFNYWGRDSTHEQIADKLRQGIVSALVQSSVMYCRTEVNAIDGYRDDVGVSEELDLYLRLAERGRLANLPEVLMTIYRHPESFSATRSEEQRQWSRTRSLHGAQATQPPSSATVAIDKSEEQLRVSELYYRRTWLAIKSGFARTARKYARCYLRMRPWNSRAWRLVVIAYCAKSAASMPPQQIMPESSDLLKNSGLRT